MCNLEIDFILCLALLRSVPHSTVLHEESQQCKGQKSGQWTHRPEF